jgi:hypothetical protein
LGSNAILRGTLGPLFYSENASAFSPGAPGMHYDTVINSWAIWPNLELAYRLNPSDEITLGGNAIVGGRHMF